MLLLIEFYFMKRFFMKKIFVLFSVLATLLISAVFTGCDIDDSNFVAPKDKWVYKEGKGENSFEYKWGDSGNEKSVKFDVYVNYATKDAKIKFDGQTDETAEDIKPGLNIILVPIANSDSEKSAVQALFDLQDAAGIDKLAVFKAFGNEVKAEDTQGSEKPVSLSSSAWTIIYNFNRFEDMGNKSMSTTAGTLTLIKDLKNLNMKRVLYNMLGNKLLGE